MPLKIRCPHCRKVLLAEDQFAGEQKLCPACGGQFTVPIPSHAIDQPAPTDAAAPCPRCHGRVAPGTEVCPRCHTVLATGQRLPLGQRLRRVRLQTWTIGALMVVGATVLVDVGIHVLRTRLGRTTPPAAAENATPVQFPTEQWAARLLNAVDAGQRRAARDKLVHGGGRESQGVAHAVAQALADSLGSKEVAPETIRNRLAAIDVLAQLAADSPGLTAGAPGLWEALARDDALREAAWRARAALGDVAALEPLREAWLRNLRDLLLLTRLAQLTQREKDPAMVVVTQQLRRNVDQIATGLHRLQEKDETGVLDRLLMAYWESWPWLGQARGARVAAELFEQAKPRWPGQPRRGAGFEEEKTAIRGARDVLDRIGQRGSPLSRAAAGLVMAHAAPQYSSARQRLAESLPAILAGCSPAVQQELTWAVARLTGRQFGQVTAHSLPTEVGRADVEAVLRWGVSTGAAKPTALATPAAAYPTPLALSFRIVSATRLLERDLLAKFQEDWPQASAALGEWAEAGIGCRPGLLALLNPGQHAPHYPALAAAIALAADCEDQSVRRPLMLWRTASDQPAWVGQLAYTALGALDARRGRWDSGWPAGLDLRGLDHADGHAAGWTHFGLILAAGGTPMLERLQSFKPAPLPPEVLAKLLAAGNEAARLREGGGR